MNMNMLTMPDVNKQDKIRDKIDKIRITDLCKKKTDLVRSRG
jgi:hypothetical protein